MIVKKDFAKRLKIFFFLFTFRLQDKLFPELISEFNTTKSYEKKLKILTLSPFTIKKTIELFDATYYMVQKK